MSPGRRILLGAPAVLQCVPRRLAAATAKEELRSEEPEEGRGRHDGGGRLVAAGAGVASATDGAAGAHGAAADSPGVVSGNLIQVPVHVPVNVFGNSVNVIGVLNPAFGNLAVNH